ncbi:MAG: hypothetical protein K2J77_01175 [Oscillospiraceae bacterium]|nr:hypothetical protein [Oscillospiraceae bacterium]
MSIITWIGLAVVAFSLVMVLIQVVRSRVVAGKAGIIKVCVPPSALAVQLICAGLFAFFGVGRPSAAREYFDAADKAEMLINAVDGVIDDDFQQVSDKSPSESIADIRKKIANCRQAGEANKTFAASLFILAAGNLILILSTVWYITEEGILMPRFKVPEPFCAKQNGNKIELHYLAQFKNATKVISFKATPKNLAVFGRFMVWEQNTQNVPLPQSPQYQIPQNPQDANIPNDKEQL